MNSIAVELIQIIFSYACADDHGKTARTLGLVSKGFREIAAPLEFRSLLIAGPQQLSRLLQRLEAPPTGHHFEGYTGHEREYRFDFEITKQIRHILICDVSSIHSLASDSCTASPSSPSSFPSPTRTDFWSTPEGQNASREYSDCSENFRTCIKSLLRCTSSTLQSLSILAYSNPMVHSVLSGMDFPRLRYLAVKSRSSRIQSDYFSANASFFVHPTAPQLRQLHYDGPSWAREYRGMKMCFSFINPFIKDLSSRYPQLNHLVIKDQNLSDTDTLIQVLRGLSTNEYSQCASMTHRAKAFIIQMSPTNESDAGFQQLVKHRELLTAAVERIPFKFLEVRVPTLASSPEGKGCFEAMLDEWAYQIVN